MKRWAIISVIFITIFAIFIGCQRRESTKEEVYKEFQKKIVTMSSYKCIAEIEASGNKSSHNYVFIHSYVKADYYKLEVVEPKNLKGKTMEYKGDKVIISNPDIKDKIELPNMEDNRQYAFIGDFIKNYLQNEEVNIKLSNNSLILETTIPGNNKYFNKQILYVNKDTKNPEKMEILNDEGKPSFTVKYKEFECKKYGGQKIMKNRVTAPTWAEINLDNINFNLNNIRKLLKEDTKICTVLKANAYGHGSVEIAKFLENKNVDYFAVARLEEAIELRENNIKMPIL